MRASVFLLSLLLALLCLTSFVLAQDDAASEPVAVTTDAAAAGENGEVPAGGEDKPNDPWKPTKLSGLALGENSALAIPVPILFMLLAALLSAVGYGIYQLLDSEKQKERAKEEAKAKKLAKKEGKNSSKKK